MPTPDDLTTEMEFLDELRGVNKIPDCLDKICSRFDIDYAVYYLSSSQMAVGQMPYVQTNFPAVWLRQYLLMNYFDIDPVLKTGFKQTEPTRWSEVDWSGKKASEFLEDAVAHGVGPQGYIVPILDKRRHRALLSVCSGKDAAVWRGLVKRYSAVWTESARIIHKKAVAELFGTEDQRPALAPRELECLNWVAKGKDAISVASILDISEHTVRDYCKSAKIKLGCVTLTQAVHKATRLHLIGDDIGSR